MIERTSLEKIIRVSNPNNGKEVFLPCYGASVPKGGTWLEDQYAKTSISHKYFKKDLLDICNEKGYEMKEYVRCR